MGEDEVLVNGYRIAKRGRLEAMMMSNEEKRVSPRIPIKVNVHFLLDGDYLISLSKDISPDGMFLSTESPINVGQSLELSFKIEKTLFNINAEVVWVNYTGPLQDKGMGIRFTEMDTKKRDMVLQAVTRVAILEGQSLS